MRYKGEIKGFVEDAKTMQVYERDFLVHYTGDKMGKTLSIGDIKTGVQYSIPFDGIYKIITGGKR